MRGPEREGLKSVVVTGNIKAPPHWPTNCTRIAFHYQLEKPSNRLMCAKSSSISTMSCSTNHLAAAIEDDSMLRQAEIQRNKRQTCAAFHVLLPLHCCLSESRLNLTGIICRPSIETPRRRCPCPDLNSFRFFPTSAFHSSGNQRNASRHQRSCEKSVQYRLQ